MPLSSNVSAQTMNFGMVSVVWSDLNVVVGRFGTKLPFSAIALNLLIGMDQPVCFA